MESIAKQRRRLSLGGIVALAVVASCGGEAQKGGVGGPAVPPPPRPDGRGTASASSVVSAPVRAVDGDLATRWTTGVPQAPGQWFQVDLEAPRVVAEVVMDSGSSAGEYARAFEVFAFDDPTSIGPAVATGTGAGQVVTAKFGPRIAGHVRIVLTGSASEAWSIHEVAVGGTVSPAECVALVQPSTTLMGEAREVRYQEDILKYCTGAGIASCEQTVRARINVDFFMAAAQLSAGRMSTGTYLAVVREREAKLRAFRKDPGLACDVAAHDRDGDYVPDGLDACPSTPPLTPVLGNGCTNPTVPDGPDIQAVNKHMPNLAVTLDPRCAHNAPPPTPMPLGMFRLSSDPSVGKAIWISRDPGATGCPVFYEVELVMNDGALRSTVFKATEDVTLPWVAKPERAVQFNVVAGDGGARAAWAEYGSYTKVFRARVFNLAGQASSWSDFVSPERAECSAGLPTGDGYL